MTVSFKVSSKTQEKMEKFYKSKKRDNTPQYAVFQAKDNDTVITLYESGKVVFQGISADIDATIWKDLEQRISGKTVVDNNDKKKGVKEKTTSDKTYDIDYYNISAIGSDEVGTGDFFGPIIVTAAYVKKDEFNFLEDLGIKDSKKLTDEQILKIAPEVIKNIPHETIILTNKEYNDMWSEKTNMNAIKAILHNKVLFEMKNNITEYDKIIVDQFTTPKSYFFYLYNNKVDDIAKGITFVTKAEDKNLAVACASVISRYIFLKEMDKLSEQYEIEILKGASNLVDQTGKSFIEKHGFDKLSDVAKMNFSNVNKIKEL